MTARLDGHIAVITGAGSGIGRETAVLAARQGASLALCDINETGLKETAELARTHRAEVLTQVVDVSDPADMEAFAAAVYDSFGRVDLLVNNAGIAVLATFMETELADWDRQLQVNLMGVVHGCRAFVPRMIKQPARAQIVNVASMLGYQAMSAMHAYSVTKFAVFGFSEALRDELAPHGIGVTTICPGMINTAITHTSLVRGEHATERLTKLQRLYARRGYGPDKVAARLLMAARRNKAVAPISPEAHVAYVVSRVAPPLSRWMTHMAAKLAT
ncbi:MAG: SDR family NAD(P)-dependent oxidoreductase [Mycobacterium sp.]|nr:SDR family NAD(P)-dependent oxidoreductase [Mycobacterium sp.]